MQLTYLPGIRAGRGEDGTGRAAEEEPEAETCCPGVSSCFSFAEVRPLSIDLQGFFLRHYFQGNLLGEPFSHEKDLADLLITVGK